MGIFLCFKFKVKFLYEDMRVRSARHMRPYFVAAVFCRYEKLPLETAVFCCGRLLSL
jgi:hypothetical protein